MKNKAIEKSKDFKDYDFAKLKDTLQDLECRLFYSGSEMRGMADNYEVDKVQELDIQLRNFIESFFAEIK